ncbi:hypothetical protein [Bosea sp. AS-1]|uniref:hypothetical protein n=1 Tax=Bosea sp. AS-1 TaxID=2015316 RepID=UPI000B77DF07|nr:hypothetical protein [Bosea sp. AS-1]
MPKYQYSAGDHPDYHQPHSWCDAHEIKHFADDLEFVAEQCAENYHDNGGYEDRWPVEFRIYTNGTEVARFNIEREYEPSFCAWPVEIPVVA